MSAEPLPGGSLYRAVACRGTSRSDCVSTTVFWAPIWLDDAAEIPATIRFKDGNYARIDKRADLFSQLLDYNVYRYAQFAEGAGDLSKLPRMAKPGPRMDTLEETVYANVYPQYMRRRACNAAQNLPID